MNYDEIVEKVTKGGYQTKLPYSPYGSVGEEANRAARRAHDEDRRRLYDIFKTDIREMVEEEFGRKLTDNQFDAFFGKAWEDGHSSGHYEVVNAARNLIDMVKVFLP